MYLSNRDIRWAILNKLLIVNPAPDEEKDGYDETSIDLHLDTIDKGARVWDIEKYRAAVSSAGQQPELRLGAFHLKDFSRQYLTTVPQHGSANSTLVYCRGNEVVVKPTGFLLWTTREWVGTPKANPLYICFVNAKSTKARTGVVVHLSAPTIHAGWQGNITLEIVNFGPFDIILQPGDAISQLTVAAISNPPDLSLKVGESATSMQTNPSGSSNRRRGKS